MAGCACRWEGDRYPEGTDAYAEAQLEYDRHVANVDEPEGLQGTG